MCPTGEEPWTDREVARVLTLGSVDGESPASELPRLKEGKKRGQERGLNRNRFYPEDLSWREERTGAG